MIWIHIYYLPDLISSSISKDFSGKLEGPVYIYKLYQRDAYIVNIKHVDQAEESVGKY